MEPIKVLNYDFGRVDYFDSFAVGTIHPEATVTTTVAKQVLGDLKDHYKRRKMVYISNREFNHNVDLSVYKLIDAKHMIGIALIAPNKEEIITSASQEQAAYSGSFGVFNTMDSAISWAQSFVEDND